MEYELINKDLLQRFKDNADEEYIHKDEYATVSDYGIVKPDGSTIIINNGVISSTGGGGGGSSTLSGLIDVSLNSQTDGQGLVYNEVTEKWENQDISTSSSIDTLLDVNLNNLNNGQILKYNSEESKWQNEDEYSYTLPDNVVIDTDYATTETAGIVKPDGTTITIDENGVVSSVGGGSSSEEMTLNEYLALTEEQKMDGTERFITDANMQDVNGIETAGSLKPWLFDGENEVLVGVYGGKPLYRKTLEITPSNSIGYIEYQHDIQNVDHIHFDTANCFIRWNSNGNITVLPYISYSNGSITISSSFLANSTSSIVSIYQGVDRSTTYKYIISLLYTKTSDAAGSGNNLMPYGYVKNPSDTYSTSEQIIGRWVDGKPLYQKTINLGLMNYQANVIQNINHGIQNIEYVTKVYGTAIQLAESTHWSLPLPHIVGTNVSASVLLDANRTTIQISCGIVRSTYTAFVTLQYTKTTD